MPNGLPTTNTWLPSFGPSAADRIGRTARGETRRSVKPVWGSAATHRATWRRPRKSRATIGARSCPLVRGTRPRSRGPEAGRSEPKGSRPMIDHHAGGHPPRAGRGIRRGVFQCHDGFAGPRHRRGDPPLQSIPRREQLHRRSPRGPRRRTRRPAPSAAPGLAGPGREPTPLRPRPAPAPRPPPRRPARPRTAPIGLGDRSPRRADRRPAAPRPQRPSRAPRAARRHDPDGQHQHGPAGQPGGPTIRVRAMGERNRHISSQQYDSR